MNLCVDWLSRRCVRPQCPSPPFPPTHRLPSIPSAAGFHPSFVRGLRRYYAVVRLPDVCRPAYALRLPDLDLREATVHTRLSRFPHKTLLHMIEASDPASQKHTRITHAFVLPSALAARRRRWILDVISWLNTLPVDAPVNASPQRLLADTHHSGTMWTANPSSYRTFTLSVLLVFIGARTPNVPYHPRGADVGLKPF